MTDLSRVLSAAFLLRTSNQLLCALLCLTLISCETLPPKEKSLDEIVSSANTADGGGDIDSAEYYIHLANQSSGDQRQQYLLRAAEKLYARGDITSAQSQLQHLNAQQLEGQRQLDIQLLAARIALASGNMQHALELLPKAALLSPAQNLQASLIRADADFAMGYYLRAANSRIALDAAIADGEQREQNHQAIWRALSALPDINLDAERSSERITQGWLELARLMRRAQTDVRQLQNAILDWGTKYANHPVSNTFIDRMLTDFLHTRLAGNKIAVILPLSGQYQLAGEAIQNGFISAYFADKTRSQPESTPVDIHFYDAGTAPASFIQQYQRAKLAGAGMIVGPLDKAAVNELVTRQDIDVPVVTLNYAEDTAAGAANLYQFGLLPEDEARQIAELAIRQKRFHAASLVPDSEWGARIQNAFRERYETLGGRVHSVQQYAADKDDYSYPIRHMLNIDKSEDRRRSIDNIIGEETRFVPYRRQDIDMIFLAATPRAARSIMPALKFHHAADLPVYATSHAYSGQVDKKADRDLNGLIFCDLPWNLVSANPLKTSFSTNWPEQKNYTRLYALGVDTYYLLHNVDYLKHHPYARFSGETGNIRLGDNNRLHRELVCAQFRNDVPVYLDTTLPSEPVIERDSDNS